MEAGTKVAIEDHWFDSDGARLFARSWSPVDGRGRSALVLLHDSLGSVELWRDFPAALAIACGRRVIAYDRRGFGRSDPHDGKLALDFIASEADGGFASLIDAFALENFIVFGHSVGGGMAVNCGARWNGRCLAVITVAAQAFVEERTRAGIREARTIFAEPGQLERLARYHGDKAAWVLDAWVNTWLSEEFTSWSLASVLPALHCPLLVIHGAEDEYGSPRHPELLGELAGGPSEVHVLPATRHMPHRERCDQVLALASEFLASLP